MRGKELRNLTPPQHASTARVAESGIPDYRSPNRPEYNPLKHGEFVNQEGTRRRYWARSMVGYPKLSSTLPNDTHKLVVKLQGMGHIGKIITQNVDRHHQGAGSKNVLELHGTVHEVHCMTPGCDWSAPRTEVQDMLLEENAGWLQEHGAFTADMNRPDGDVDLAEAAYASFQVPPCPCGRGSMLKPSVIFHGGTIPKPVTEAASQAIDDSDGLLVLGTTLTTWSAFRLAKRATAAGKPVAVVNFGPTRADTLTPPPLKLEAATSAVLHATVGNLLR